MLLVCWNQGFDIGAFGAILYREAITAWIFAISAFLALCYIRLFNKVSIRPRTFIILLIPILWPAIDFIDHHFENIYVHYFIIIDYVIIIFGLMYAAYLFLRLIKPDIFEPLSLKNKLFILLAGITFSGLGFFSGLHNNLFLECAHFELSGDYIPHNCRKPSENKTDFQTLHRSVW